MLGTVPGCGIPGVGGGVLPSGLYGIARAQPMGKQWYSGPAKALQDPVCPSAHLGSVGPPLATLTSEILTSEILTSEILNPEILNPEILNPETNRYLRLTVT